MLKLVDCTMADYAHEILTKHNSKLTRAEFDELAARFKRGDKEAGEKIMIAAEGWSKSNNVIEINWLRELPRDYVVTNLHSNVITFVEYMHVVHGFKLPGLNGGMLPSDTSSDPNTSPAAQIPRWLLHAIRAAGLLARDMVPYRMRVWYGVKFVSAYLMANYLEHTNEPGRAEYNAISADPLLRDLLPWAGITIELVSAVPAGHDTTTIRDATKMRIEIATDVLRCLAPYKGM